MKAVILAGGFGTRISEYTQDIPKPMIRVGGRPILWHIMKYYSSFGVNEFILCLGYKSEVIQEYFLHMNDFYEDIAVNLGTGQKTPLSQNHENWHITMINTGLETGTAGRLRKIAHLLNENEPFHMTYGDGLSNIDLTALVAQHNLERKLATVTAICPPSKYGYLTIEDSLVTGFEEKPATPENVRINGGFFIIEPQALEYITNDGEMWENQPMHQLIQHNQLTAYKHDGFWHCIDTLRDLHHAENLWRHHNAQWKVW